MTLHLPIIKIRKTHGFVSNFSLKRNQIETCVVIKKLISLRFRYSTCLILLNGQFYIPKTLNTQIKN
jgi:hypothetical protein